MSLNLNDIKYPDYVTGIKDVSGDFFKGGYNYLTTNPSTGYVIFCKQIKHFEGSDIVHPDGEGGYTSGWETYYIFPNGYEMQFKVSQNDARYKQITSRMIDVNGSEVTTDVNFGNLNGFRTGFGASQLESGMLNWPQMSIDIYMSTDYAAGYVYNPSPGADNYGLKFSVIYGVPTALTDPYDFHLGDNFSANIHNIFAADITSFLDLEKCETYLHSVGRSFTGDVFTDDPFSDDPAGSDDTSTTGGGGGNYDNTSDPIDFPDLPTNGALVSGGIQAHRLAVQTVLSIMTDLWDTSLFDISTWQKVITDPINAIVSFHALPFSPEVEADANNLHIGNMDMHVNPPKVVNQYYVIHFDPVEVPEYWGSALDYSPYVKVELFLPFIKTVSLAPEDVIGNIIEVRYHADVLTGDCIAFIKCGNAVLYRFPGNCKQQIPLTVQSNTAASQIKNSLPQMASGVATGGGAGVIQAAATVASNVAASKINTQRSGDISGSIGMMDDFVPYLIIHRPKQSLAKNYNQFKGYPSNITAKLGDCIGYTEVEHIHLTGITGATDAELQDIEDLLKSGVII